MLGVVAGRRYGNSLHDGGVDLAHKLRVWDLPLLPVPLVGFVAAVVVHNLVMNNARVIWSLPVTMEFYVQPAIWALEMFFLSFSMFAIVTLAFKSRKAYGVVTIVFGTTILLTVSFLLRSASGPIQIEMPHRVKDGVITQTTSATCAAASGANVASYFGIATTEAAMAEVMNTNRLGTSPSQIIHGMQSLGLHARKVRVDPGAVTEVNPPAVLLVYNLDQVDGHAVALMGIEDGLADVWDPAGKRTQFTAEEFREEWVGHAIEVSDRPF